MKRLLGTLGLLCVSVAPAAGAEPVAAQPQATAGEAVPERLDTRWPREKTGADGARLLLYEPQLTSWQAFERLEARAAVAVQTSAEAEVELGSVELVADTATSLGERLVQISNIRVTGSSFPSLDGEQLERLRKAVASLLPGDPIEIELDRVLAGLERSKGTLEGPRLSHEPPTIFVSQGPALLVMLDGEPVLSPIEDNRLKYVVNTNWDLLRDETGGRWYLRFEESWLSAPGLEGPWQSAGQLPDAFYLLPAGDNWAEVRASLPGAPLPDGLRPRVYVSQQPAELIVIEGEPELEPVAAQLQWVANSDSDLFWHSGERHWYYLVSGRWFRAASLEGPWSFATAELPADFAELPEDHERAHVRASVPGTAEAEEAVLLAQIPQKATVERGAVEAPTVLYQGEPKFEQITGTALERAVNTRHDVLRSGEVYYLCHEAVWFRSAAATGPWELTDTIPSEVAKIPPESPAHNVTHVHIYDSSPTSVTYGYTSGYMGSYWSMGVVYYGTGWYYPPYVWYGSYYPVYYWYPYSYGVSSWYNPATGAYGRSARWYGPYGGMGYGAAYNPRTGTYARGAAAWGPYQGRGWAEAYNPRTGTYARSRQGYSPYGSWGTTGVRRGDDWVRTARVSDGDKGMAGWRTSSGGRGFVGSDGNSLYAGRDGNVYRRTEDGWQQHDGGGSWSPVERGAGAANRGWSAEQQAAARERAQNYGAARGLDASTRGQLERDARARVSGAERSQAYQRYRSSGGSFGGRGGYSGGGGFRGRRR